MSGIRSIFSSVVLLLTIAFLAPNLLADGKKGHETAVTASASAMQHPVDFIAMPGPGKKVPIGKDHYFVYGFDKKPRMGTVILKVQIYTNKDKKDSSFEIMGNSGMPSMEGAHDTGNKPFKISKKGDYLLPIDIVMPGDWEIKLTVSKAGKVVFRGKYQFDV